MTRTKKSTRFSKLERTFSAIMKSPKVPSQSKQFFRQMIGLVAQMYGLNRTSAVRAR